MKIYLALILSCASVMGADTGIRVHTKTVREGNGVIHETDVFTRGGKTSLVRDIRTKDGALLIRTQKFYHDGLPVASVVDSVKPDAHDFVTEAGSPYWASFRSRGAHDVGYVYVNRKDGTLVDIFTCTNGLYFPDDTQRILEVQQARKNVWRTIEAQLRAQQGR